MADETVLTVIEGGVATVTVNRPDKRNALNAPARAAMCATFARLDADADVRVVIVTGTGEKAFVAGADIREFAERTPITQHEFMTRLNVTDAAEALSKPVIAAINGFCLGIGCELAMACDIRIASDTASFGQPEVNLGLLPGSGGTQRLPRLVGLGNACKLLYTGELIPAAEALRIGLVDEVVPASELMPRVRTLATAIAAKSPVALRYLKEAVRATTRAPLDEGLRFERSLFGLAFASRDKEEGVRAFLEKRKPNFGGT